MSQEKIDSYLDKLNNSLNKLKNEFQDIINDKITTKKNYI